MYRNKKGKEVDSMSTMKPIEATPTLRGRDAISVLAQSSRQPNENAIKKNNMLHSVLSNIRK